MITIYVLFPQHPNTPSFPTRRSSDLDDGYHRLAEVAMRQADHRTFRNAGQLVEIALDLRGIDVVAAGDRGLRSEEHTSELQSLRHLVCRLLLEKKKNNIMREPQGTRV